MSDPLPDEIRERHTGVWVSDDDAQGLMDEIEATAGRRAKGAQQLGVGQAVRRAQRMAASGNRPMVGITGPPGVGKSTVAGLIRDAVDGAVLVGMDGFHLAHSALQASGLVERKGAPETFDGAGYVQLLRRIRAAEGTVWAPEFRRQIEDAIAGAVAVQPDASMVVTEGNYLLLPDEPWRHLRSLLDEIWYIDLPDDVRRQRLETRHIHFGRTASEARKRTLGSDEANARLIQQTRHLADAIVIGR